MNSDFKCITTTSKTWKELYQLKLLSEYSSLQLVVGKTFGSCVAGPFDSSIQGCHWHRIAINADIPENSNITIHCFISDNEHNSPSWDSNDIISLQSFIDNKDALILALNSDLTHNSEKEQGRYITLKIELKREKANEPGPVLKNLKLFNQRTSYLRYLPACYQDNEKSRDFLERFLSIFESSLFDMEESIAHVASHFDPSETPSSFIPWLAQWLSLDLYELLGEKNREFILKANDFYRKKGTVQGLSDLIEFLTGPKTRCRIKEYSNNTFRVYGMEHKRDDTVLLAEINQAPGYYRKMSTTVDTNSEEGYLTNIGTFTDELHYVTDASATGRYSKQVVGIYIFVDHEEYFNKDNKGLKIEEKDLLKIIATFLPVFVRAEITIVPGEVEEEYNLADVVFKYNDKIYDQFAEEYYKSKDYPYWNIIHSHNSIDNSAVIRISNDNRYKTFYNITDVLLEG